MMMVKYGRLRAKFSVCESEEVAGPYLSLKSYQQEDYHSCGFLAALTVVRYYLPRTTTARDVLATVRPSVNYGVGRIRLVSALRALGLRVRYRKDLTVPDLRAYVNNGVPVIVSVWPDDWYTDHWVVVRGFSSRRVHLTNYGAVTIRRFRYEWTDLDFQGWSDSGEGLVCSGVR